MNNKWIALLAIALTLVPGAATNAQTLQIGDRVGVVLATDIAAYVNGASIPSMNIGGYTAVTAEDLRNYGFDVEWSPTSRSLVIEPRDQAVHPITAPNGAEGLPVGSEWKDVLYTDILAFYGDKPIPSYNIDGQTTIVLNDLAPFGAVDWDGEKRTISFQPSLPGVSSVNPLRQAGATIALHTDKEIDFKLQFADDGEYHNGVKVGYAEDGLPFFKLAHFTDLLGYSVTTAGKNVRVSNGLYTFSLTPDLQQAELYWGGAWVKSYSMIRPPHVVDGNMYLYSIDMERLFGYIGTWNQEKRTLDVWYSSYTVGDYGLPGETGGESATIKAAVTLPANMPFGGANSLGLILDNGHRFGNLGTGSLSLNTDNSNPMAWLETPISLTLGDNTITASLTSRERIVYMANYGVRTSFADYPLQVDVPGFTLDQTKQGFLTTDASNFTLSGKALSGFSVRTTKWDLGSQLTASAPTEVKTDASGAFQILLPLQQGNGLYRVDVLVPVATPRGPGYSAAGHFYIHLLNYGQ
jgi:hypothetical protein